MPTQSRITDMESNSTNYPVPDDNTGGIVFLGILALALLFGILKIFGPEAEAKPMTHAELRDEALSSCRVHHIEKGVDVGIFGGSLVEDVDGGQFFVITETKDGRNRTCRIGKDGKFVIESN
ncbi:hypothetical protein [uncultured Paraglaciecola sp.]|uniref:hypothetical protein n=1 Tax=uncultured Paraglaciecola sp. TaxID=1765024 RepID=UPI002610B3C4|nr:hypothetical protein [uncultured Paraglaciecola sp.]